MLRRESNVGTIPAVSLGKIDTIYDFRKMLQGSGIWVLGAFAFFILLAWTVAPARNLGFSSDDLTHLVEDAKLPWYMSSDHLNRPLRNGLFRLLASVFGLEPEPYRCIAFLFYCATALLLWQFLRQLGASRGAAFVAAVLFAFFPRNHDLLFWFAAFQDLIVSTCVLIACIVWLSWLRDGGMWRFLLVHLAYIVALGFKEISIGLPVILLCLDVFAYGFTAWRHSWTRHLRRYWLFLPIVLGYVAYILIFGSFHPSKGVYAGTSLFGVALPLLRTFVNLMLPFSYPISLRDITASRFAVVAGECALLGVAIWKFRDRRWLFLGLFWFLIFSLPTAAFARSVNADRYLMLPYMALLLVVAGILNQMEKIDGRQKALLFVALSVYAIAGSHRLAYFREEYRQAAVEVDHLGKEMAQLINLRSLSPDTELTLANLVHGDEVSVLNNGLKGLLILRGLPRNVPVLYNFENNSAAQTALTETLKSCGHDPRADSSAPVLLLLSDGTFKDISSACATQAIQRDRRARRDGWVESPGSLSRLP